MDIDEIRDHAQAVLDRPRSTETLRQYARAYRRLDGQHWYDYAVAHDYTKRSAYKMKAAYQHAIAERVLELLAVADRARHRGADEDARAARQEAETLANELAEADYERENRFRGHGSAYQGPSRPRAGKRSSKRATVRLLPDDWQVKLINAAVLRDRRAVALLVLTGARPAELEKGIKVERDGDRLRVTIQGAKTGQGHGQPWRHFRIAGPIAGTIAEQMVAKGVRSQIVRIQAGGNNPRDAFRKRLVTAAQRAGFAPGVSPYTLRHALAAELKAAGVAVEDAAAILGHSVTQTQSMYGHAAQGGRGTAHTIDCIETAQPVRDTSVPHPGEAPGVGFKLG